MIRAAEQIFEKDNGEYSSLIWLDYSLDDVSRPLIFLVHSYGWWKGFPDRWKGEVVRFPHPGTVRGFAYLIDKASLQLGTFLGPERHYQTKVETKPFQTEEIDDGTYWEFEAIGRQLQLYSPGMNWHVEYS